MDLVLIIGHQTLCNKQILAGPVAHIVAQLIRRMQVDRKYTCSQLTKETNMLISEETFVGCCGFHSLSLVSFLLVVNITFSSQRPAYTRLTFTLIVPPKKRSGKKNPLSKLRIILD